MTAKHRKRKLDKAAKRRVKKAPDTMAVEVVKTRALHLTVPPNVLMR